MRTGALRLLFSHNQGYVCLSCRSQIARVERGRRYQHAETAGQNGSDSKDGGSLTGSSDGKTFGPVSSFKKLIGEYASGKALKEVDPINNEALDASGAEARRKHTVRLAPSS